MFVGKRMPCEYAPTCLWVVFLLVHFALFLSSHDIDLSMNNYQHSMLWNFFNGWNYYFVFWLNLHMDLCKVAEMFKSKAICNITLFNWFTAFILFYIMLHHVFIHCSLTICQVIVFCWMPVEMWHSLLTCGMPVVRLTAKLLPIQHRRNKKQPLKLPPFFCHVDVSLSSSPPHSTIY